LVTGTKVTNFIEDVSFHPNPFDGSFNLIYEASHDGLLDIRIYTITGSIVLIKTAIKIHEGRNVIPVHLEYEPEGVYFLEYKSEEGKAGFIKTIRN
jgi:hypothetical protein